MADRAITYRYHEKKVDRIVADAVAAGAWSALLVYLQANGWGAPSPFLALFVAALAVSATAWSVHERRSRRAYIRLTPGTVEWSQGGKHRARASLDKTEFIRALDEEWLATPSGNLVLQPEVQGLNDLRARLMSLPPDRVVDDLRPLVPASVPRATFKANSMVPGALMGATPSLLLFSPGLTGKGIALLALLAAGGYLHQLAVAQVHVEDGWLELRNARGKRLKLIALNTIRGTREWRGRVVVEHDDGELFLFLAPDHAKALRTILDPIGAARYRTLEASALA